jgi:hypothetical protein
MTDKSTITLKVEWSDEDNTFVGYCDELFGGGVCDAPNRLDCLKWLEEIVEEELADKEWMEKKEKATDPK